MRQTLNRISARFGAASLYVILLSIPISTVQAQVLDPDTPTYVDVEYNMPLLGNEATVYLGDRMLTQQTGQFKECVTPLFSARHEVRMMGATTTYLITENKPLCKLRPNDRRYTATYPNVTWSNGSQVWDAAYRSEDNGTISLCLYQSGLQAWCERNRAGSDFRLGRTFIYSPDTIQRTIEYAGRTGTTAKFVYFEFVDDEEISSSRREFEVDLSAGMEMAYKGAVIVISSASNSTITYRVMRNFRGS